MVKITKLFKRLFIISTLISIVIGTLVIIYLNSSLPSVETLKDVQLQVPLKIYSNEGLLIAEYGETRRTPIKIEQVPQNLINAFIAIEDRRFYQHPGVDLKGIMRAFLNLIKKGNKEQGGSTITMQVARNFFLSRKKTYLRKINEILLSLKIEKELSKKEILELYLNKIYLGKRAYGIAAAAEVYYGTTIDKLNLAQIAMIAGLPKAPSMINPIRSAEAALKRRNLVLEKMLDYNFISQEQYLEASNSPINTSYHTRPIEVEAEYVAEMVRQEMIEKLGDDIYIKGYEVFTTINSDYQKAANQALSKSILEYDQRHGFRKPKNLISTNQSIDKQISKIVQQLQELPKIGKLLPAAVTNIESDKINVIKSDSNIVEISFENMKWAKPANNIHKVPLSPAEIVNIGDLVYIQESRDNQWKLSQIPEIEGSIVAMHPDTGAILALSGGFDYEHSPFNRATQAERQPGSTFKPFVYSAALENKFTAASIINDAPIIQEDPLGEHEWRPQNHTKKFYGPTRLRIGITQSRNLVSIRILRALGIEKTIDFLERFGFNRSSLPNGLSLALGTTNITPLEFTARFCTFPNGGFKIEPYIIDKILDSQRRVIFQHSPAVACEDCSNENMIQAERVISPQVAYLTTSLLQDAIKSGTGRKALELGRTDLAGKTGSTNDHYDAWFTGYNRNLVATAWMGYDEPKSIKEYARTTALSMWMYFMGQALKGTPNNSPEQPPGIVTAKIDPHTGLLAKDEQSDAIYELFTEETVPTTTTIINNGNNISEAVNETSEEVELF